MAQRSEDGVGKTSEMSRRLKRAKAVWTRSAISIQASSRDEGCINRPDTRKHLNLRARISPTPPCIRRGVHTRTFHCDGWRCAEGASDGSRRTLRYRNTRFSSKADRPLTPNCGHSKLASARPRNGRLTNLRSGAGTRGYLPLTRSRLPTLTRRSALNYSSLGAEGQLFRLIPTVGPLIPQYG